MAKRKAVARDVQRAQGAKMLAERGVRLTNLLDRSVTFDTLATLTGTDARVDLAVAFLLGDVPAREAAQFLVEWEGRVSDKDLRREIHRSLYKLSQKGVVVDRAAHEPARSVLTPVEPEGYLSTMDGRGDRLVWLVKMRIGGGLHYLSALVNEPEGLRHVEGSEASRKALRLMRQDLSAQYQINLVAAPWRYCDYVMHEGYERAKGHANEDIGSYPALRSHVISAPAEATPVPLPTTLDREEIARDETLLATSSQLFEEPELQRWLLDQGQVSPYLEQVAGAHESALVLSKYQQQDRIEGTLKKAVSEIFGGRWQPVYVRRFQELAFYLAATERVAAARRALAVAVALEKGTAGGTGIPFCEDLVRQSIGLHYTEEARHDQEEAQGSLIMKPSEFAAQAEARRRQQHR